MMPKTYVLLPLLLVALACGDDTAAPDAAGDDAAGGLPGRDAAALDVGTADAGSTDGAMPDAPRPADTGAAGPTGCGAPATEASLTLPEAALPAGFEGSSARFIDQLSYGPDEKHLVDLFLVDSAVPTPLVIYVHGGGFVQGNRRGGYNNDAAPVLQLLEAGISFASIDYRLLAIDGSEADGVRKPLSDGRRALQFLRHHAVDLNVDPTRIAMQGTSAGAGISLWVGWSPEACDPTAADPILRMSTQVSAIAATNTQATYDLVGWETEVYAATFPGVTLRSIVRRAPDMYGRIAGFYGISTPWMNLDDLYEEPVLSYRAEVDMLSFASSGDPSVYLSSGGVTSRPETEGSLLHHPLHAVAVFEAGTAAGIPRMELHTRDRDEGETATPEAFLIAELL